MSGKRTKPKKDDAGVLGNLPATRATRFGGERSRGTGTGTGTATATATKAKTPAKPKAAAKPKPRTSQRPRPVRAGAPALKESTERARAEAPEPPARASGPPSGTELVTTAIQAAGELAQIGLTVGGQVLKRAVKRLPKP